MTKIEPVMSATGKPMRMFLGKLGSDPAAFRQVPAWEYRCAWEAAAIRRHLVVETLPWGISWYDRKYLTAGYLTENGLAPWEFLAAVEAPGTGRDQGAPVPVNDRVSGK